MRIALCLSGQARSWKSCYQNWLDNLSHLNAEIDFFFHFLDYNSMPMQVWTTNNTGKVLKFDDVLITDEERSEMVDTLQPKAWAFEPKLALHDGFYEVNNRVSWWSIDQFNSMMKCAHLKRQHEIATGKQYDVVLRMRSDLFFTKPIDISNPQENTVYITHPCWDKEWNAFRISDIFFWSDSSTYDQAAAFHDQLPFIEATYVSNDQSKVDYPPELALYYYFKSCGLKIHPSWPNIKIMRSPEYIALKGRVDHYETI
jgi:hypothetical protein